VILITVIAARHTSTSSSPWKLQSAQELITHDRSDKSGWAHFITEG